MDYILKEHLFDANERVESYKKELEEHDISDDDKNILTQLCIEANFQAIHDMMTNQYYFEYNEWIKRNATKKDDYCMWVSKIKNEENEKYLDRYNRRMKKV